MAKGGYSVAQLAKLAQVTERTLRYYDQIGLLVPARDSNGYRVYGEADVRQLQRILLLRSCDVPLSAIAEALADPHLDIARMLQDHLADLRRQREHLAQVISATEKTIGGLERFAEMSDNEKFEQLKRDSVVRFEEEYGEEARQLYGDEVIDASNERMLGMSQLAWDAKEELEQRIKDELVRAMATDDPTSPASRMVAGMHAQWIKVHWGENAYTPEAHVALAEGYLADPRFIAYYDGACGEGATEFLRDIIKANVG